ncbi:Ovarian cancer-associated protein 2 [Allomyces javanicus]|nr:Ovarian cancer-associated protein 2 [Allomyces javanicus]
MTPSSGSAQRLRILCLHGYTQNASVFSKRTAALRKSFKKRAEFVYVTAPLYTADFDTTEADAEDLADVGDEGPRAWFRREEQPVFREWGYDESFSLLKTVLETQGPFDAVLGFSQGMSTRTRANMAALLAMRMHPNAPNGPLTTAHPPLRFAILSSGFVSLDSDLAPLFHAPVAPWPIPTLHIWGAADEWVPANRSRDLAAAFANAAVYEHAGGHFLPTKAPDRAVIAEFLDAVVNGETDEPGATVTGVESGRTSPSSDGMAAAGDAEMR